MTEEFGWSHSRRRHEIKRATEFLGSMGIPPETPVPQLIPHSLLEKTESFIWSLGSLVFGGLGLSRSASAGPTTYSRGQFGLGEVEALTKAFRSHAKSVTSPEGGSIERLGKEEVRDLLKDQPGYENISGKELDYVFEEAGFSHRTDLDADEFLEVCAGLKEVTVAPAPVLKTQRRAIPVEKSGGGV